MSGTPSHRIVFVCQHGAFRSRIAAAFFNSAAPSGWEAVSAGLTPQSAVSTRLAPLLAGTTAQHFADYSDPQPLDPRLADVVVAIDAPLEGAETWTTDATTDEALRDEIGHRVARLLEEIVRRPPV